MLRLRVLENLYVTATNTLAAGDFLFKISFFPLNEATGMLSTSIECQSALQARRPSRLCFFSR